MITGPQSAGEAATAAVYRAMGNPPVNKPVTFDHNGQCGTCRRTTGVCPAGGILTSQFGTWDEIAASHDGKRWLCMECAALWRNIELRRRRFQLSTDGALIDFPDLVDLTDILTKPLPPTVLVSAPISGKRIVAPTVAWGHVATDGRVLAWDRTWASRLATAVRLRRLGVSLVAIMKDPSIPFAVLAAAPPSTHAELQRDWRLLDPIRADKTVHPLMRGLLKTVTP